MTLNQSALLEVLDALKVADVGDHPGGERIDQTQPGCRRFDKRRPKRNMRPAPLPNSVDLFSAPHCHR
jgi:hypothetical protein